MARSGAPRIQIRDEDEKNEPAPPGTGGGNKKSEDRQQTTTGGLGSHLRMRPGADRNSYGRFGRGD